MSFSMEKMFMFIIMLQAMLHAESRVLMTAQRPQPNSHVTIQGSVFCDVCHDDAFSRHSYFLPGVNVHVECKLKANSPGTSEQIAFSVNRTTDKLGVYKLDINSLEGIDCAERPEIIHSFCKASLRRTSNSSSACSIPSLRATTTQLTLKSKQQNLCIYSMSALSLRPRAKNASFCGNKSITTPPYSFNSSKFFLPTYGYFFTWPPLPQLPPMPTIPPWPPMPQWPPFFPFPFSFPPLPSLPPLPPLPSLPPLPPLPPFSSPSIPFPRPPSLPGTYPTPTPRPIPFFQSPPSPPAYNPRDPSTWIPNNPLLPPPQPPGYNLGNDPRSWMPYYYPPSPPTSPSQEHP